MIEDNKVVKKIEVKSGGKSGTYWTVTWADDKRDNIFNGDWLPLLEQSQKEGLLLHYAKEKAEGSQYYNIKTLELAPVLKTESSKPKEPLDRSHEMTKEDWAEKDKVTRKSIERQKSLECAIELGKILGADKVNTEKIIATAKVFEVYLEGKEIILPKTEGPKKGE